MLLIMLHLYTPSIAKFPTAFFPQLRGYAVPKTLWEKLLLIVVLLITGAYINFNVGNLSTPRVGKWFPTAHA